MEAAFIECHLSNLNNKYTLQYYKSKRSMVDNKYTLQPYIFIYWLPNVDFLGVQVFIYSTKTLKFKFKFLTQLYVKLLSIFFLKFDRL